MTAIAQLADSSRVWIYAAKEEISSDIIEDLKNDLERFAGTWAAHSVALKAAAEILHNRFIVLFADESQTGASGCSIDSSVRFIKGLEAQYGLDLFDRMNFVFKKNGEIKSASADDFSEMYKTGEINDQTIVFDNLVKTKGELDKSFEKKLADSWHSRMV